MTINDLKDAAIEIGVLASHVLLTAGGLIMIVDSTRRDSVPATATIGAGVAVTSWILLPIAAGIGCPR